MPRVTKRLFIAASIALGVSLVAVLHVNARRSRALRRAAAAHDASLTAEAARRLAIHASIARASAAILEALHRADPHAYTEYFAEDAVSIPALGPIVRGREAIAAAMATTFAKIRFVEAEMSTLDTRMNGESVLETGRYRYVVAANQNGKTEILTGRYVIAWKRHGDSWKIVLDAAQPGAVTV